MKYPFGYHQLVPILVIRVHKNAQKPNNNGKKSAGIGEHLINLPHFPLNIDISSIHAKVNKSIIVS